MEARTEVSLLSMHSCQSDIVKNSKITQAMRMHARELIFFVSADMAANYIAQCF